MNHFDILKKYDVTDRVLLEYVNDCLQFNVFCSGVKLSLDERNILHISATSESEDLLYNDHFITPRKFHVDDFVIEISQRLKIHGKHLRHCLANGMFDNPQLYKESTNGNHLHKTYMSKESFPSEDVSIANLTEFSKIHDLDVFKTRIKYSSILRDVLRIVRDGNRLLRMFESYKSFSILRSPTFWEGAFSDVDRGYGEIVSYLVERYMEDFLEYTEVTTRQTNGDLLQYQNMSKKGHEERFNYVPT